MTTKQVFTLSAAERDYLQAAVRCMQAVEAEASANIPNRWAELVHFDACLMPRASGVCSLDHEQAADLLLMLSDAADIELHVPAEPSIDDDPMGFEAAFVESAAAAHCRM